MKNLKKPLAKLKNWLKVPFDPVERPRGIFIGLFLLAFISGFWLGTNV